MARVRRLVLLAIAAFAAVQIVRSLLEPPGYGAMVLLALQVLALVLVREAFAHERRWEAEDAPPAATVEQLVAATASEEEARGFSCIRFEFPWLACPRSEFDAILARHEALLRAHLQVLTFLARRKFDHRLFVTIDEYAAEIDARGKAAPRLAFRERTEMATSYADVASVAHRLAASPGRERVPVVVIDDYAVSVRRLDVWIQYTGERRKHRELMLEDGPVTFEPVRQHVEQQGDTWVRRWRSRASSPVREERFTLRPPASSPEECLDRLFAACQERLRERIAHARKMGWPMDQPIFWCGPGERFGPYARTVAYQRDFWPEDLFEFWPQCDLVLRKPWTPGWHPVLVTRKPIGGIRWIALEPGVDERTRPASVTEWKAGVTHSV